MPKELSTFIDNNKRLDFLSFFESVESPTYGDVVASGLRAGLTTAEIKTLQAEHYTQSRLQQHRIVKAAQDGLEAEVSMNAESPMEMKLRQNARFFALETLGKKDYSKKIETDSKVTVRDITPESVGITREELVQIVAQSISNLKETLAQPIDAEFTEI